MKIFDLLKKNAKKSKLMVRLYGYFIGVVFLFSPILASRIMYRVSTGKKLHLVDPQGLNEKLMWLKHFWTDPIKGKCSDKLLVREFVRQKGCEEILNEVYAVYDSVDQIDWRGLPHQFVMKCTYGAGANVICPDKDRLDVAKAKAVLQRGLSVGLLHTTAEFHGDRSTNKIICEKYIDDPEHEVPTDYKVYCFNGKPMAILALNDRFGASTKMLYDTEWNRLVEYANEETCSGCIEKPEHLDDILLYAERLSEDFPFVRVDFYDCGGKVVFGELTFTPAACLSKAYNALGDEYFGSLLRLPSKHDCSRYEVTHEL